MSKRFYYPQQQGERKKAKLDVTISDHNFPLSQNNNKNKDENKPDNWGDESDDEILLLASQACEEACNQNNSALPDYSICMQPSSTSTQIYDTYPSTSKNTFKFKKPAANATNIISTSLKNKCELISSPLPGICKVIQRANQESASEDLIFNDKIYKGDTDYVHRQLLQLQEENTKLKSENGKLLEKCVTKDGEVSILRTQLKTSQVSADNERLEKIKVQERVQMEWMEKLTAAHNQLQDLRTQLDFKNLEITSIKEKCKMLESSKIKLTQVNVPKNDTSTSYKHNSSIALTSDKLTSPLLKRVKNSSKHVQTEYETISNILELNVACRHECNRLSQILPLTIEPTLVQHSLLEYNEKLQRQIDYVPNRCKVFSTFHRIPNTSSISKARVSSKKSLNDIHNDLAFIASGNTTDEVQQRILNASKVLSVFKVTVTVLNEVEQQLEILSHRTTTAFQKEMDEKYIEATSSFLVVSEEALLCGSSLYKEEQAITARRFSAILYHILEHSRNAEVLNLEENESCQGDIFITLLNRICSLLDKTSCAVLYSGLLQALTLLLDRILTHDQTKSTSIMRVLKTIIESRPMLFVSCESLQLFRKLAVRESLINFCRGSNTGNLKLDYDQGVFLYKKDTCFLQVLVKQVEAALVSIEKQKIKARAVTVTWDLLLFYSNLTIPHDDVDKPSCECRRTLLQALMYALRICAAMTFDNESGRAADALAVCRGGLQALYRCTLRDPEFVSLLGHGEGYLIEFCEAMRAHTHDELHSNMLSEVMSTFQISHEDCPSFHREPWLKSFRDFNIYD